MSQVKVDGYKNHAAFQELGTDGHFYFYFLNEAGSTPAEQMYSWYHGCDAGEWSDDGKGWYDPEGNLVGTDVDDLELTPGDAIYLLAPEADNGETFTFGDAGQVLTADQSYPLNFGVNIVGNMMPITQKLSEVTISGYENHAAFQELGTDGHFYFYILNEAGSTPADQMYSWYHGCDAGEWSDDGKGWYDGDGNLVGTDVDDIELTPGDAIYLLAPKADKDDQDKPTETFTFGDAGQVLTADQSYPLIYGVNVVGNMMPITQKLSEVTISGYENHAAFQELGTDSDFYFYFLNEAGGTPGDQMYSWYHGCDAGEWYDDGKGWYDGEGNLVGTDVDDIDLKPGQGLYLLAPKADVDDQQEPIEAFTVDFAAPKLK